jgi:hypothetical protein
MCQLEANAPMNVRTAALTSDASMMGLRPNVSDNELMINIDPARKAVVSESARLLAAALTPNSREKTGSNGWTQYRRANVEKPAASIAIFVW